VPGAAAAPRGARAGLGEGWHSNQTWLAQ